MKGVRSIETLSSRHRHCCGLASDSLLSDPYPFHHIVFAIYSMFITTRSLTLQLGGMTKLVTNWTMKAIWYLYIDVMVACYCKRKVFSREAFPSLTWISTKAGSIVIDTKNIAELKEGPKVLILDILYINWCPSWTMMIMTSCGRCTSWARWCSQRLSTSRLQCLSDKYLLSFLLQLCQVLTSCFWYIFNSESFPAVLSSYVSDAICWISKGDRRWMEGGS